MSIVGMSARALMTCVLLAFATTTTVARLAHAQALTPQDLMVLERIREEGSRRSQVMNHAEFITNVGPRLTASPNAREAGEWAAAQLKRWGAVNVALEPWRPFNRPGWSNEFFAANVTAPRRFPIQAYPQAWSRGTKGAQTGDVVFVKLRADSDFVRARGTLRGKWVITEDLGTPLLVTEPVTVRMSAESLDSMLAYDVTAQRARRREIAARIVEQQAKQRAAGNVASADPMPLHERLSRFLYDEGALGRIDAGRFSGGIMGSYAGSTGSASDEDMRPDNVPVIVAGQEDIGRMLRLLRAGERVTLEVDMRNRFIENDGSSFNVVGELAGRDRAFSDQIVMLGAHLDSWQVGTGATDNAAGVAVMLEAMRILAALDLPLRRTVRIALWTGEEQHLLGSAAYVRAHFGYVDSTGAHFTPAHAKLSGYFNLDNGTGSIRALSTMENEGLAALMRPWVEPLQGMGVRGVTTQPAGGSDHLSFDAALLPSVKFIQDPLDYYTRTWHTSQDVFERLQPAELMRNAVTVAWLVYKSAMLGTMLPRDANLSPIAQDR